MTTRLGNSMARPGRGVPNLVVSQRVIDKMSAAAARHILDETGEAMVGLVVPGKYTNGIPTLYVLDTIAPLDDSAVREWGTFQQGEELQEEQFWWLSDNWDACRQKGRALDGKPLAAKWDVPLAHLGDWHKQPGFMIQPSHGDLMTARRMLADGEIGLEFVLAPIVTLDHPSTTITHAAGANFVAVPRGDDTSMRVDFWYIDHEVRDFQPISPAIYPEDQLPALPAYPWHIVNETRYKQEYSLLETHMTLVSAPLHWDTGDLPLHICLLVARHDWEQVVLLDTAWDYPATPPRARLAPDADIGPDDDIFEVFEELWNDSKPVGELPGWKWSPNYRLIDYINAIEDAHGLRVAAKTIDAGGALEAAAGAGGGGEPAPASEPVETPAPAGEGDASEDAAPEENDS